MKRSILIGLAASVAALLLMAPVASAAKVELGGGKTTLKLAGKTAAALQANGVAVKPLKPAKVERGRVAFPIVGGAIDPKTARGAIAHSGGLAFKAGSTRVALRDFRVHVGERRGVLTAAVGEGRLPVLSLSLAKAKLQRKGVAVYVRGIRATLTGKAAGALNAAFDTSLFERGLPIGRVAVKAVPAGCR